MWHCPSASLMQSNFWFWTRIFKYSTAYCLWIFLGNNNNNGFLYTIITTLIKIKNYYTTTVIITHSHRKYIIWTFSWLVQIKIFCTKIKRTQKVCYAMVLTINVFCTRYFDLYNIWVINSTKKRVPKIFNWKAFLSMTRRLHTKVSYSLKTKKKNKHT